MNCKKKLNRWMPALIVMAVASLLASCLGKEGNTRSATLVGVARFDALKSRYLLDTEEGTFYSATLDTSKVVDGGCYMLTYEVNYDRPENSNDSLRKNGYYTVSVLQILRNWSRYTISSTLTDTATVLPNEVPIVEPIYQTAGFVRGILFLQHVIEQPENQSYEWTLSYNGAQPVVVEGPTRYYDVYLRAVATTKKEGKPTKLGVVNAYDMARFFEVAARAEKEAGKRVVNVRFNYASSVADGKMVWKRSQPLTVSAARFTTSVTGE